MVDKKLQQFIFLNPENSKVSLLNIFADLSIQNNRSTLISQFKLNCDFQTLLTTQTVVDHSVDLQKFDAEKRKIVSLKNGILVLYI